LYDDLVQVVGGLEVTSYEISINSWTYLAESYRISLRICSTCSMQALLPLMRLSARSS
jgi:hypothetical protein